MGTEKAVGGAVVKMALPTASALTVTRYDLSVSNDAPEGWVRCYVVKTLRDRGTMAVTASEVVWRASVRRTGLTPELMLARALELYVGAQNPTEAT